MGFDATLAKPEVVSILKELARPSTSDNKEDDLNDSGALCVALSICIMSGYTFLYITLLLLYFLRSSLYQLFIYARKYLIRLSSSIILRIDEEENVSNLRMEAAMPLDQVIGKYQSEVSNPHANNLKNEKSSKRACPYLRGRKEKDKASCSSSGAGCSSSSSAWNTNEADVSSSSQPCGSSMSSTMKRKESSGSNEAEQVLDSTTSNGNMHASVPVVSTDDMETAKSADMPDSSEDVKEKVSSPGKSACSVPVTNEVELNGAKSKRIEDADSSKGGGDNVSSSSCTPVENGDAGQQERISSSDRRRVQSIELYQSFLKKNDEESEGDDDDDENDESFDGVPERYDNLNSYSILVLKHYRINLELYYKKRKKR